MTSAVTIPHQIILVFFYIHCIEYLGAREDGDGTARELGLVVLPGDPVLDPLLPLLGPLLLPTHTTQNSGGTLVPAVY